MWYNARMDRKTLEKALLDDTEYSSAGAYIAAALAILMLVYPAVYYNGFVLLSLYNWFLASIPGFPALTMGNMIGLQLILGFMISTPLAWQLSKLTKEKEKDKTALKFFVTYAVYLFLPPTITYFFGWLYQMWFM